MRDSGRRVNYTKSRERGTRAVEGEPQRCKGRKLKVEGLEKQRLHKSQRPESMSSEKWKLGLENGTSVVTHEGEISLSLWFCLHSVGPSVGRENAVLSAHFDKWENYLRFGKWLGKRRKSTLIEQGHGYVSSVLSLGLWAEEGGNVIPSPWRLRI